MGERYWSWDWTASRKASGQGAVQVTQRQSTKLRVLHISLDEMGKLSRLQWFLCTSKILTFEKGRRCHNWGLIDTTRQNLKYFDRIILFFFKDLLVLKTFKSNEAHKMHKTLLVDASFNSHSQMKVRQSSITSNFYNLFSRVFYYLEKVLF